MGRKASSSGGRKNKKRGNLSDLRVQQPSAPEQGETGKIRQALSGWPIIIGWLAMLIFTVHACPHMVAAGDTWVAMACGRHFVNHGVDTVEPFSANSHKPGPTPEEIETWPDWAQWITDKVGLDAVKYWHPTGWVNQNWLTHKIFYSLTPKASYADGISYTSNALVYWKFTIYILTVICVFYTGRLLGANPALCAVFACFAMFIGRSFLDVRPAGFSNLLVAVFLLILALTTYRNILYIWLVVPLTVFWCNVHGGYLYLFIILFPIGPFVLPHILTNFSTKRFVSIGTKGIYHTVGASAGAFLAMIIFNPFHFTNLTHTFVISLSKNAARWRDIHEWHPAFSWKNPVGTAHPFLVMLILSICLLLLWMFSRLLKPRFLKAPKNELEVQRRLFTTLSKIFGCAAAVMITWVSFISLSFLNLNSADFFICALFVLLLLLCIYKSVHFIYLAIPLILLSLWFAASVNGCAGRYIYPFILLPTFVILYFFASVFSKKVAFKAPNIAFVAAAAIVSLFLMISLFDPFRKFGLTPWPETGLLDCIKVYFGRVWTTLISSKQFFSLVRPWRPKYEVPAQGYKSLFPLLYLVNILSVGLWLAVPYLKGLLSSAQEKTEAQSQAEETQYQWPKIDLALMAVAALTIYMAYRSRRFIPIAAYAACPLAAVLIDQIIRTISAARNFHRKNRLTVSPMSPQLRSFFAVAGIAAVLFFGPWWGLKFKRIYLDAWPADPKLNSVFMRMTASDAKPFRALKFIKDNKLKGKMFNYWTEGGFIGWGQEPDQQTGHTALQLFMDGRAQAAYDRKAFDDWTSIIAGGPTVASARARGQKLTPAHYKEIGKWTDQQLTNRDVWVTLMPAAQFDKPFVRGLEYNPKWRLVFFNNKQRLFVDMATPQGKKLFDGILNEQNIYPHDFETNLIRGHTLLLYGLEKSDKEAGFELLKNAFKLRPSPAPMVEIIIVAWKEPELRPKIIDFCEEKFDGFVQNKQLYIEQHGYRFKIEAARLAAVHLQKYARAKTPAKLAERLKKYPQADADSNAVLSSNELAKFYIATINRYASERNWISKTKRW